MNITWIQFEHKKSYNLDIHMNIKWSLKTKNKIIIFMRMKTFSLNFQGLESKFSIFIEMKNLFNPIFNVQGREFIF